jgi:hypothetical protein
VTDVIREMCEQKIGIVCRKGCNKKKYTMLSKKLCYVKYIQYCRVSGQGFKYGAVLLIDFIWQRR